MEAAHEYHPGHRDRALIDDSFYEELVGSYRDWGEEVHDASVRERSRILLDREARFLDQGRYDDWLALYSVECLYWVPGTPGGDPRREVAIAFDDRRRLEDRIYRLKTGSAWSQSPASRTARLVSNVEVFQAREKQGLMVRSSFMLSEFRAGETHLWSGWCGHRLTLRNGGYQINVKQVNLIDCDQNLRNPSFVL
jgi:3-phenylpropionate/cinnamic acid dioxygenase small subunit